jgi:hypothetical protein
MPRVWNGGRDNPSQPAIFAKTPVSVSGISIDLIASVSQCSQVTQSTALVKRPSTLSRR